MDEYISREAVINITAETGAWETQNRVRELPAADVQPVKYERWVDHEKLIGIFGTLCDYMVDNGRCDVFCPYAETKDKDDECEAWRTIQKIRREDGGSNG